MKKATRLLTLTGLSVLTGTGLLAGPAQAAPGGPAGAPAQLRHDHWDDDEVVGYYRTIRSCERAGLVGERSRAWDDFHCDRVRWGFRRGAWALVVHQEDWNDRWDGQWRPGQWPSNWTDRPQWPGPGSPDRDRPGRPSDRPGQNNPDRPGPGRPGDRPGQNRPDRPGPDRPDRPDRPGPGGPRPDGGHHSGR
ncbi:hypothetical protein [Actinoplanes teichomyceticus]|uniref:Uncharacterized protein n=1 Tax=Actinoplanes teichomyceticus TaxID=1867 RepID=A0A561VQV8_ACTTI|nr:hypothetical protein [Actinoplanes teichomyceticus]TWG14005.1 hypothetical protein FHX34_104298 [Actinoplanes teichomyceticus]GIF12174.1 hypothetical protein Ate01nite_22060 [Actinoplanes teichomyceticus]